MCYNISMIDIADTVLNLWRGLSQRPVKMSANGWWSGNAVCCTHNNETQDKRGRGGIKSDEQGFSWHCFNCNYTARFTVGRTVTPKMRNLLQWMGMTSTEIQKINLKSLKSRSMDDVLSTKIWKQQKTTKQQLNFKIHELPAGARDITMHDKQFVNYLKKRKVNYADYNFKITPTAKFRNKNRIIIPYMYKNTVTGWTSRYLDDNTPKYLNENQQEGYVFGLDFQKIVWDYVIVAEGIFDAISIQGLSIMNNEFTESQLATVKRLGKTVIVVPDQDKAGLVLVKQAIKAGFAVSIPKWDDDVHDINEAVIKYGKSATLLSIMHARESTNIKITMALLDLKRRKNII